VPGDIVIAAVHYIPDKIGTFHIGRIVTERGKTNGFVSQLCEAVRHDTYGFRNG
jgi:hypothetical protein